MGMLANSISFPGILWVITGLIQLKYFTWYRADYRPWRPASPNLTIRLTSFQETAIPILPFVSLVFKRLQSSEKEWIQSHGTQRGGMTGFGRCGLCIWGTSSRIRDGRSWKWLILEMIVLHTSCVLTLTLRLRKGASWVHSAPFYEPTRPIP